MHIVFALLGLSFLIFIHELGHYLVARWTGVTVYEFAIGFGPRLFHYHGTHTIWSVRAFPFGGFVHLKGATDFDEQEEKEAPDAFLMQHPFKRILILLGGVTGNFVGGIVLLCIILGLGIQYDLVKSMERQEWISDVAQTTNHRVIVYATEKNSPLHTAGVLPNDQIESVNGTPVYWAQEALSLMQSSIATRGSLELSILRENEHLVTHIEASQLFGLVLTQDQFVRVYPQWVIPVSVGLTAGSIVLAIHSLPNLFQEIVKAPTENLGGPIMIVSESSKASQKGLVEFLGYGWMLSLSLIVLNMIPLPVLDGGKILLLLPELLFKKKLNHYIELALTGTCALALIAFMIAITISDIQKLLH